MPLEPTISAKASLRAEMRLLIGNLTDQERQEASTLVVASLQRQSAWREARHVLLFAPLASEVDVWPVLDLGLAAGKTMTLPRFDSVLQAYTACTIRAPAHDLVVGRFSIREPNPACPKIDLNRLDLVLAPGLAFDLHGARLGRGKGFYDRLLATVRGTICGVAYDRQILGYVPAEPHDIHVHCILTPTRWIDLQAARRF